jgi:hypothetical protein
MLDAFAAQFPESFYMASLADNRQCVQRLMQKRKAALRRPYGGEFAGP